MADNPQTSIEIQDDSSPTLATSALQTTLNTQVGIVTETAPASDTASSGLNGRLQRIAQRISSLITTMGSPMQNSGGSVTANAGTNLNTSALALETTQQTTNTRIGDLTETAPGTDTASSGLNGRLQRIAQRLTSLLTATTDGTQLTKIRGASSATDIGNISDALKVYPVESLATYGASVNSLTVAANPTDVFLIKGSSTKIVKIRRLYITGFQNNASYQDILVIKRSADNTGGTRASVTAVSYDSNDAAATASVFSYTANPSALGTTVGTILSLSKMISGKNSIVSSFAELFTLTDSPQKTITLNNANEYIAINLTGVTMAGSDLAITVEWTEE